jgi:hypothetical protein
LAVLAVIIALGRDSSGSGEWFHNGRGILSIVKRLVIL